METRRESNRMYAKQTKTRRDADRMTGRGSADSLKGSQMRTRSGSAMRAFPRLEDGRVNLLTKLGLL
jgi:hypothetical protein